MDKKFLQGYEDLTVSLKDKQIEEGWERLKMLGVEGYVSKDFKVSHKVYYSERQNNFFCAVLYWLDNNEKWLDLVNKFEEKTNNLVYHAQFTRTSYGDMLSLFFVSSEEEEWEQEREDLKNKEIYAYVINLDEPDFSEYGLIGIESKMGGVVRTW